MGSVIRVISAHPLSPFSIEDLVDTLMKCFDWIARYPSHPPRSSPGGWGMFGVGGRWVARGAVRSREALVPDEASAALASGTSAAAQHVSCRGVLSAQ